jgi:DNA-binding transcriptional MerR regulator
MKRKEISDFLSISIDTLRNWEMNGLLDIKRSKNGYRVYNAEDIKRIKIIRTLRCANYSLSSILRMLNELSSNPNANIKNTLDTPKSNESIISACDKLITSLENAKQNILIIIDMLSSIKSKYYSTAL